MKTVKGALVRWLEDDGKVAEGTIESVEVKYSANLGMDLTHVVIRWHDGLEPTQHTLESMRADTRVEIVG